MLTSRPLFQIQEGIALTCSIQRLRKGLLRLRTHTRARKHNEFQVDTDDTILTNEHRKDRISIAMKKLGNMTRKLLDKHATTDVFAKGGLLLGGQAKSRKKAIGKTESKRELIYASIKYFEGQLDERRARLKECILRSSNPNSRFIVPSYKQLYRQRMRGRLN
jgi:hypothetical protein